MMNKISAALLLMVICAALAGCGRSGETSGDDAPADAVTGYLVDNASKYVTLGDYDNLEVEKSIYPVTDEDVDSEIESRLDADTQFISQDTPAEEGDQVNVDVTCVTDGVESTLCSDYDLLLGNWEFGDEFDQNLEGHTAGETLTFSITYDDTAPAEEWVGKTIDFTVVINDVKVPEYKELDDDYLKNLGYDSEDDYREAVRSELEDISNLNSEDGMYTDLFEQAYAGAAFDGYPDDLYEKAEESIRSGYEALLEELGSEAETLTTDTMDMESDILDYVNRWLFISAYCEENDLYLTEDYLSDYEQREVNAYNYGSVEEYEMYTSKDTIVEDAYIYMIGKDLSGDAEINEVTYDYTDEDMGVISDDELETDAVLATGDDVVYADIEVVTE